MLYPTLLAMLVSSSPVDIDVLTAQVQVKSTGETAPLVSASGPFVANQAFEVSRTARDEAVKLRLRFFDVSADLVSVDLRLDETHGGQSLATSSTVRIKRGARTVVGWGSGKDARTIEIQL